MTTLSEISDQIQLYAQEQIAPLKAEVSTLEGEVLSYQAQIRELQNATPALHRSRLVAGVDKPGLGRAGLLYADNDDYEVVTGYQKLGKGSDKIEHVYFPDGIQLLAERELVDVKVGPPKNKESAWCVAGSMAAGLSGSRLSDCLIDAEQYSPALNCLYAGNCLVERTEIRNGVDLVSFQSTSLAETILRQNWLHDTFYFAGDGTGQSDRKTHNDGYQFHRGKNISIIGDYVTGVQMQGIMLKQEVSSKAVDKIENVLFDRLFIGTMKTGFNISVSLGNTLDTISINAPQFEKGKQAYTILRPATFKGSITNPVYDDGSPAPIRLGG